MTTNYLGDNMPVMPWMMDLEHTPEHRKSENMQYTANNQENRLDYLCNLSFKSKLGHRRLTQLGCALLHFRRDVEYLESLIIKGISFGCIDTSAGTQDDICELIGNLHQAMNNVNQRLGYTLPFLIGMQVTGLRIRTGLYEDPSSIEFYLTQGNTIILTNDDSYKCACNAKILYIEFSKLHKVLLPKDKIFINYGDVILEVTSIDPKLNTVLCQVINGGIVYNESRVIIPRKPKLQDQVTNIDLVRFGIQQKVDALVISHVQRAFTIEHYRKELAERENGAGILLIAKIDNVIGVENVDEIIEAADAIIIGRGDLGLEIPLEKLFLLQKSIIAKCNKVGKPVGCANHLMKSMLRDRIPTRSDILDVANCVMDGVDFLCLTEELLQGKYYAEAIKLMSKICKEAEAATFVKEQFTLLSNQISSPIDPIYATAIQAVDFSIRSNACCIIVLTTSGRSARLISRFKPKCPILAVTRIAHVARKLNIWKAVVPIYYTCEHRPDWARDCNRRFQYGITYGKVDGLIKAGDPIVLVCGWRPGSGFTNTLRIVYASKNDCIIYDKYVKKN